MLRFWIAAISILALHTAAAADQSARDNRANQLNPNNDAYRSSRGMDSPSRDFEDDEKAARDNRANQLNPNNEAYRSSRGLDRPSRDFEDDEKAARDNRANQLNPNNEAYRNSRGLDRPSSDFEDDEKAARDDRANHLNPNNEAYRQRLMRDIVRDIEAATAAEERWNCCEGVWCRPQSDEIASTLTTNRRNGNGTIVLYRRASGRNIGDAVVVDTKLEIEDGVPVWRFRNHHLGKKTNRIGSLKMMRGIRPEQDKRGDTSALYTVFKDPGPPPDYLKSDIEKSVWAAFAGRVKTTFNCRKR